jgi:phosphatidylethanolamine/phosphatidyl-N-methylethanolamine N-methyltransferase
MHDNVAMQNQTNLSIYRLWAPLYDSLLGAFFLPGRRRAMEMAGLRAGENALLVGVGTGADLPLIPVGVDAVGIDLSPDMLARARARLPLEGRRIALEEGNAQELAFASASFDVVLLNLILSVVPDAAACLREARRVLRPGGRIVVFDKFLARGATNSPARRLANFVTTRLGTDITRRLEDIAEAAGCTIVSNEPSLLGGQYRVAVLRHAGKN